jgi:hypothetical protein
LEAVSNNREFNREYRDFSPFSAFLAPNYRVIPAPCSEIPYATEQGIFANVTGKNREFGRLLSL